MAILDFNRPGFTAPSFAGKPIEVAVHNNGRVPRAGTRDRTADHHEYEDGERPFRPQILSRRMADIEPMEIRWTWENKIPRGRLAVVAGDGGLGKSFATLAIASTVTTGARWPDGAENGGPKNVVLLNAEDDASDTIRPRLDKLGADCSRVHIVDAVLRSESGDPEFFSLVDDLRLLENLITEHDAALCVVDPIGAYLLNVDTHKDSAVRAVLAPLASLAQRTDCAVVAVCHLNKGGASNRPASRVSGSLAFSNAARMCWIVAADPEDDRKRLVLPYKTNIVERAEGIAFVIEDNTLRWLAGPVEMTAESVLQTEGQDRGELERATEFLMSLLARGPMPYADVRRAAEADCISWRTVERAKKSLGILSSREGFGKSGHYQWAIPDVAVHGA